MRRVEKTETIEEIIYEVGDKVTAPEPVDGYALIGVGEVLNFGTNNQGLEIIQVEGMYTILGSRLSDPDYKMTRNYLASQLMPHDTEKAGMEKVLNELQELRGEVAELKSLIEQLND
jgi:hypothetical protein